MEQCQRIPIGKRGVGTCGERDMWMGAEQGWDGRGLVFGHD